MDVSITSTRAGSVPRKMLIGRRYTLTERLKEFDRKSCREFYPRDRCKSKNEDLKDSNQNEKFNLLSLCQYDKFSAVINWFLFHHYLYRYRELSKKNLLGIGNKRIYCQTSSQS